MAADTHLSADHSLVREGTSRESDLIESLCTRLGQKDEAKLVLIPLEGITLTEAAVEIGAFRLRLMNDEAIAEATALWNAGIDQTTNTPDQKAIVKEWHAKQFESDLRRCVCIEVRVSADVNRAEAVAVQQVTALIDLLRSAVRACTTRA